MSAIEVNADFPSHFAPLFSPYRYKIMYGGRSGGKSWASARALIIQGMQKPLRILCAREVLKSIKDSVHQLLSDQIQRLGLGAVYQILDSEIRCANGTKIVFSGLASHTVESVKSMEGIDRVWVEEGQTTSARSWDILTPTIRAPDSEIWITLNPLFEHDDTYSRFIINPPPNSWVMKCNYTENPWHSAEMEAERLHAERTFSPEKYRNIWLGEPIRSMDGAYYAEQMEAIRSSGRIRSVPYQAGTPVNTFWDLGWNDTTAIWWHQRIAGEDRFLRCYEMAGESLDHYAEIIQSAGYVYDQHYLPHDAESKSLQTGKSVVEILRGMLPGHRFTIVPRVDNVLTGIHETRLRMMGPVYFDETGCKSGLTALERYRKKYSEQLKVFTSQPLHDEYSNLADAFRQWGQGFRPSWPMAGARQKSRARSWKVV